MAVEVGQDGREGEEKKDREQGAGSREEEEEEGVGSELEELEFRAARPGTVLCTSRQTGVLTHGKASWRRRLLCVCVCVPGTGSLGQGQDCDRAGLGRAGKLALPQRGEVAVAGSRPEASTMRGACRPNNDVGRRDSGVEAEFCEPVSSCCRVSLPSNGSPVASQCPAVVCVCSGRVLVWPPARATGASWVSRCAALRCGAVRVLRCCRVQPRPLCLRFGVGQYRALAGTGRTGKGWARIPRSGQPPEMPQPQPRQPPPHPQPGIPILCSSQAPPSLPRLSTGAARQVPGQVPGTRYQVRGAPDATTLHAQSLEFSVFPPINSSLSLFLSIRTASPPSHLTSAGLKYMEVLYIHAQPWCTNAPAHHTCIYLIIM